MIDVKFVPVSVFVVYVLLSLIFQTHIYNIMQIELLPMTYQGYLAGSCGKLSKSILIAQTEEHICSAICCIALCNTCK